METAYAVDFNDPKIRRAIRGGIYAGLHACGWTATRELVDDLYQLVCLKLVDGYMDKYDPEQKTVAGYVYMVARDRARNHTSKHVHKYDGARGRTSIDPTDSTADDKAPACVVAPENDSLRLHNLTMDQRDRLLTAMGRLSDIERDHVEAILTGETDTAWGERNGMSPTQAHRHLSKIVEKLARLVSDE